MQMLLIQPESTGQTLALLCFGISILTLMWLYRRDRARLARRQRGEMPASIEEMKDRVDRAQTHIERIEDEQRMRRLDESVPISRQQAGLSSGQQDMMDEISRLQGSAAGRGAGK
ncbi:hypothetical protein IT575_04305 [bacterium]|nr:hypothetical protein [bacterium]